MATNPAQLARLLGAIGLLAASAAAIVAAFGLPVERARPGTPPPACNAMALGSGESGPIVVALHDPVELDGESRERVLSLRADAVGQEARLIAGSYAPCRRVYGAITDGKPWWGLLGLYIRGRGPHGMDGLSEESRFLVNPFLVLGLTENEAFSFGGEAPPADRPFWPAPRDLRLWPASRRAEVTYELGGYLALVGSRCEACVVRAMDLFLDTLNAEDLGFDFVVIDPSPAVQASTGRVLRMNQFIHTGPSCGVAGGCNNGSPFSADMVLHVKRLPAEVDLRLYEREPRSAEAPADLWVHMTLVDERR